MDWLNYHHLYYFWLVAREGSITSACQRLRLAQPTVSAQLKQLEQSLGVALFTRKGRRLALTDAGQSVYHRADEIFSLGRDLLSFVKARPGGEPRLRLNVGVADALPKLMVSRLLEPALRLPDAPCVVCYAGKHTELLARLSVYELDVVLSDAPIGPQASVRAFNHLLGECDVTVFGTRALASKLRRRFPDSLEGAPFLLPTPNTALRRNLDYWFESRGIEPTVIGEYEDSALLKVFGQSGYGLFVAPTVVQREVSRQYQVVPLGRLPEVRERLYSISTERRIKHPAVLAITQGAQEEVFA